MSSDLIEEIELNIREAQEVVELGEALNRLADNRDFKKVIKEAYFRDQAVQLVQAKASPSMQRPEVQAAINKAIDGIGELYQFFNKVTSQAEMARAAIVSSEEAIEELVAGDDGELA